MQKTKGKANKGITLIALVITIIVLIILAGISISLVLGQNGLLAKARKGAEDYQYAGLRERIEAEILALDMEKVVKGETLTIEDALIGLQASGTFEETDAASKSGICEGYVVELGYNEDGKVVINGITKDVGTRIVVTLSPTEYTNGKVEVTIEVRSDGKNITTIEVPNNMTKKAGTSEQDYIYEVEANGTYNVKATLNDGTVIEKDIVIATIDTLPPQEFDVTAESDENTVTVKGHTEDQEGNEQYSKSEIKEYYFKNITGIEEDTEQIENENGWIGKVEVNEANTGEDVSYTFTELDQATSYTFVMKAVDKAGNERISKQVKISTKFDEKVSTNENKFVGYYADCRDAAGNEGSDGVPDGIIYADLAFDKTDAWPSASVSYTINHIDAQNLKEYKIIQAHYNDGYFGDHPVIARVDKNYTNEQNRFYVMALKDIDNKINGTTYCWWYSTSGEWAIYNLTSQNFGKGKTNTDNIMKEWNAGTYSKNSGSNKDMWGQITNQYKKGWFVPSLKEWAAFGKALDITNVNRVSQYGLSNNYWSSSHSTQYEINAIRLEDSRPQNVSGNIQSGACYVRLSTTF